MADSDPVGPLDQLQTRVVDKALDVRRLVHPTATVRETGEVEGRGLEAVARRGVTLPVPAGIQDVQHALFAHGRGGAPEECDGVALGEADEELAHPQHVEAGREALLVIEEIHRVDADAIFEPVRGQVLPGLFDHACEVEDGDRDVRREARSLELVLSD